MRKITWKRKGLSLILSVALLVTYIPMVKVSAATTEESGTGRVFANETVRLQNYTYKADPGCPAVIIKGDVTLNISGKVTLIGGDATDVKGGGAGIYVPEGSSLTVIGDGQLTVKGGDAADGKRGETFTDTTLVDPVSRKGGRGGNGAGAGIGGNGGISVYGDRGTGYGNITIDGVVQLDVTGGNGGNAGSGGGGEMARFTYTDWFIFTAYASLGGSGGGGGGGGGFPAAGIGGGGGRGGDGGRSGQGEADSGVIWATSDGGGGGGGGAGYNPGKGGEGGYGAVNYRGTHSGAWDKSPIINGQSAKRGGDGKDGTLSAGGDIGENWTTNDKTYSIPQPGQSVGKTGGTGSRIHIKNGTVYVIGGGQKPNSSGTARAASPFGAGGLEATDTKDVVIEKASVKTAHDGEGSLKQAFDGTQTTYLAVIPRSSFQNGSYMYVTVDGSSYGGGANGKFYYHLDDPDLYFYFPYRAEPYYIKMVNSLYNPQEKYEYKVYVKQDGTVEVLTMDGEKPDIGEGYLEIHDPNVIVTLSESNGKKIFSVDGKGTVYKDIFRFTGEAKSIVTTSGSHTVELVDRVRLTVGERYENKNCMNVPKGESLHLILSGDAVFQNKDDSGDLNAGIHVPSSASLTISGEGSLDVSSRAAAAIGGNKWDRWKETNPAPKDNSCGKVTINSGNITLWGGGGAGIGGGNAVNWNDSAHTSGGDITINGGLIKISAGMIDINNPSLLCGGAAIGSGGNGNNRTWLNDGGGQLTINGGTVITDGYIGLSAYGTPMEKISNPPADKEPNKPFSLTVNGGSLICGKVRGATYKGSSQMTADQFKPVTVEGFPENAKLEEFLNFPFSQYNTNDIYSDSQGRICLYFPKGAQTDCSFVVTGKDSEGKFFARKVEMKGNKGNATTTEKSVFDITGGKSVYAVYDGYVMEYDGDAINADAIPYAHSGSVTFTGGTEEENHRIEVHESGDKTIILNDAKIFSKQKFGTLLINTDAKATLRAEGDNTLCEAETSSPVILADGSLTLEGPGSLLLRQQKMEADLTYGEPLILVNETGSVTMNSGTLSLYRDDENITTPTVGGDGTFIINDGSVYSQAPITDVKNSAGEALYPAQIPLGKYSPDSITEISFNDESINVKTPHPEWITKDLYLYLPKSGGFVKVNTNKGTYIYNVYDDGGDVLKVLECKQGNGIIDLSVSDAEIYDKYYTYDGMGWFIPESGCYTITGESKENKVICHSLSAKITLQNLNVSLASGSPIQIMPDVQTEIEVLGQNRLESGDSAGIHFGGINDTTGKLTFTGNGLLFIDAGPYAAAIGGNINETSGTVQIQSGTYSLQSDTAAIGGGLYGETGQIIISGGSIDTGNAGFGGTPVDEEGQELSRAILNLEEISELKSVVLDGKDYGISVFHPDSKVLFLYTVKDDHLVTVNQTEEYNIAQLHTSVTGKGILKLFYDDGSLSDTEVLNGFAIRLNEIKDGDMLAAGTPLLVYTTPEPNTAQTGGVFAGRYVTCQTDEGIQLMAKLTQRYPDLSKFGWSSVMGSEEDRNSDFPLEWTKKIEGSDDFSLDAKAGILFLSWKADGDVTAEILLNGTEIYTGKLNEDMQNLQLPIEADGELTVRLSGNGTVTMKPPTVEALTPVNKVTAVFSDIVTLTIEQPGEGKGLIEVCNAEEDLRNDIAGIQVIAGTQLEVVYKDVEGGNRFDGFVLQQGGSSSTVAGNPAKIQVDQDTTISAKITLVPYYIVTIPETVAVGDAESSASISAQNIKNMQDGDALNVVVGNLDVNGNATITRIGAANTLLVPVMDADRNPLADGGTAAQFTNNNQTPAKGGTIYFGAPVGDRKAGDYTGTITFTIAYQTAGN